jgi:hypothetical protein
VGYSAKIFPNIEEKYSSIGLAKNLLKVNEFKV